MRRELGELKRRDDLPPTPWKHILTCPAVIALIFAQIGHNWGLFIIINDLPKYMKYFSFNILFLIFFYQTLVIIFQTVSFVHSLIIIFQ